MIAHRQRTSLLWPKSGHFYHGTMIRGLTIRQFCKKNACNRTFGGLTSHSGFAAKPSVRAIWKSGHSASSVCPARLKLPMSTFTALASPDRATESTIRFIQNVRKRIGSVVVGQDVVVERMLSALFTGGHLLLQGVPGLAKTLLVAMLSKTIDLSFARVQFTIDLLPSDIVGSEVLDPRTNEFRVNKGPILTNMMMDDE